MQELARNISQYEAAASFIKPREIVGSKAFNIEQLPGVTDQEFREQVVSYLCEYRLSIPEFQYDLYYTQDRKGNKGLSDRHGGELIKYKAQRAVLERQMRADPIHREIAEEHALSKLDQELAFAKEGDSVIWISPPGPKEEGYGDYGFVFQGTLDDKGHLGMRAVRIDGQTVENANAFISEVLGERVEKKDADEFLAEPFVLPFSLHPTLLHTKLKEHFGTTPNKEDQEIAERVIEDLEDVIDEFVKKKSVKGLHSLENYALERKEYYKRKGEKKKPEVLVYQTKYENRPTLAGIMSTHGHEPPKVAGSCGSSSSTTINSNNPLSFLSSLSNVLGNSFSQSESIDDGFECPRCSYKTTSPVGNKCPSCKLTKEEYAKQGNKVC